MSLQTGAADCSSGPLSFDQLYERYATDVLRVSYYYLGNKDLAEDVTQDVFVKLLVNRPDLEEGREKAWLLKVALNRCRDLWRSAWIKKVVLGHPAFESFPAPDEIGRMADQQSLAEAVKDPEKIASMPVVLVCAPDIPKNSLLVYAIWLPKTFKTENNKDTHKRDLFVVLFTFHKSFFSNK